MNKELEEAIEMLEKLKQQKYVSLSNYEAKISINQATAIETILKALDNSISKEVIEDKIKEIDEEFDKKNTADNNEWYIDSNICEYAKEKLQELLEGK